VAGGERRAVRVALGIAAALSVAYALLLRADADPALSRAQAEGDAARAFAWNQDAFFDALEAGHVRARAAGCAAVRPELARGLAALDGALGRLRAGTFGPDAPLLAEVERALFELAPRVGVCPDEVPGYAARAAALRDAVKRQSERWSMDDRRAREALYRLLYGGRAAVEELLLQDPAAAARAVLAPGADEPSATPAAPMLGVTIHSGDVLLSRGGAATSALIARGNDFPGNFSHVALVHVDARTGVARIVEAHIDRGVTVSSLEDYLGDAKLRVLVLRPRADLPALVQDPMLPHRAAEAALERASAGHVAYDFAMDREDPARLFCSEVAAEAYARLGVRLWTGLSRISSEGLRRWLAAFGVRHFETLEPSDLEYDPQLRVVAEWRDPETLRRDHHDNAVTEAMLEAAERGAPLEYARWLLPVARAAKGLSVGLNAVGLVGPVPEGMSATAALRNRWYGAVHARVVARLERRAAAFQAERGYPPPYWQLVRLAREELGGVLGR